MAFILARAQAMKRTCPITKREFEIRQADLDFYAKITPHLAGRRFEIPPPTLSPHARLLRRLAHANPIHVYRRQCSKTNKRVFSMYSDDTIFPVYANETWHSDSWDELEYAQEFSFEEKFFDQFEKLHNRVPHRARQIANVENSEYCNNASFLKDCYFVFNTSGAESCFYCENAWDSRDCIDCTHTKNSELCYDCISCLRCYSVQSSQDCQDCVESSFLLNCRSCKHCFGCVNLRRAEYCIFNEQYSKGEYSKKIAEFELNSYSKRAALSREVYEFWLKHPRPHAELHMVERSSGNHLAHVQDVTDSFFIQNAELLSYCFNLDEGAKDCRDYSMFGKNSELIYEGVRCGIDCYNLSFCTHCTMGSKNLLYCCFCFNAEDCFGCVGIKNKKYCILNKQYTKEAYEAKTAEIIKHMQRTGEWGEFFPVSLSSFPYNHSHAFRYSPLVKEDAQKRGLAWLNAPQADNKAASSAKDLPDKLPDNDEQIIVRSLESDKVFLITKTEIKRLRALNAPLPRSSYDERMTARARKMGGILLYDRQCQKSGKAIRTPYSPNEPWILWDRAEYEQHFAS